MATRDIMKSTTSFPSIFEDFFKPWNELMDSRNMYGKVLTVPSVNITESKDHYKVSLAAPGLKKEDFKVNVENNVMTISAETEETVNKEEDRYTRREYSYSSFARSFTLPDQVNKEQIEAHYENGVLDLKLPKKEEAKKNATTKQISVQ
jgi:HSP20 family protein